MSNTRAGQKQLSALLKETHLLYSGLAAGSLDHTEVLNIKNRIDALWSELGQSVNAVEKEIETVKALPTSSRKSSCSPRGKKTKNASSKNSRKIETLQQQNANAKKVLEGLVYRLRSLQIFLQVVTNSATE